MRITFAAVFVTGAVLALSAQDAAQQPVFERAPDALERVSWRTRTLIGDARLTNWKLAVPADGVAMRTFLEAVVRADAAGLDFIEGSNTQPVSAALSKALGPDLTDAEIAAVRARMGPIRMPVYRVDALPADRDSREKLLSFVKAMGADILVVPADTELEGVHPNADRHGVTVVVMTDASSPARAATTLARVHPAFAVGVSTRQGVALEALAVLGDRLKYVSVDGPAMRAPFFHELDRVNVRPLILALDTIGVVKVPGDLLRAVAQFETAVQPAYGRHFTAFSRTVPTRRDVARPPKGESWSPSALKQRSDAVVQQIRAAIPASPVAAPKKPRRLLVIESLQGMSHDTIPHANVMLEEMGRITGAWTTEFSNDLDNLTYPRIAAYDGIFLNSIVGEFAADLAVRDGLLQFVRAGGGIGGVHGTPWASRNWDEFGVVFGAKSAPHRIEQGVMKVYDAASPIVRSFAGRPLNFREEYYRFEHQGANRLRWEDVRVLLTVDLDDPRVEPRPWTGYKRPDNVYPVTWVRTYGKGRMFYSSLGHMAETFTTPEIVGHFLAGVQFLLGDLDADTTPNPRAPPTLQTPPAATAPAISSVSQRPNGSSLGTIRVGASDGNIWFGWRVGVPAAALTQLTLSEALARTDLLSVAHVEVSDTQIVSPEVPKPLDERLRPGERSAVLRRFRELNQQVLVYRVANVPADDAARRRIFEFARSINAPLIAIREDGADFAALDALAQEFAIDVAVEPRAAPRSLMAKLEGRSSRLGIALDLARDATPQVDAVATLNAVKDRVLLVRLAPGEKHLRAAGEFFLAAYRAGVKRLSISLDPAGPTESGLVKALDAFERIMLPAMAERVRTMLNTPAGQIRGPDKLDAEMRRQIAGAAPTRAIATPKKPRKLLVTDIQMYSGHATIPHGNWLLEIMGKQTGAFEPVFSNDLNLLKYPKIKEFDAIYFNNVCGMVHNDPDVRDGILRFVREGGGIGGHHAVTYANNNWPEFAAMMGGWAGAHHIETQMIKVDDPSSPLTRSFGTASFEHTDEFYIFPPSSPYSRDRQRVLLSIDVPQSDRATEGRFCAQCTRPDHDYGLAWIKTCGKGRAYFTPLGHTNGFYTDQRWTNHLLAALQYILGDLDADASPIGVKSTHN